MPPPLERTYYSDVDYSLADVSTSTLMFKSLIWAIKAAFKNTILMANGVPASSAWTVEYSCDSVTAGTAGDGVDRWTNTFDGTKIVRANGAVAHSWIVLKSPAGLGPYYLCIQWNGSVDYQCNFIFSKVAFTGGTTTARPTSTAEIATNQITLFDSGNTAAAAAKLHKTVLSDGEIVLIWGKTGIGRATGALGLPRLADTVSGDLYPVACLMDWVTSALAVFHHDNSFLTSSNSAFRTRNSTGTTNIALSTLVLKYATGVATSFFDLMTTTDLNDGKYLDDRILMGIVTAGFYGIKGRLYDWRWCGSGIANGTMFQQSGGSLSHLKMGAVWIPWVTAPTF